MKKKILVAVLVSVMMLSACGGIGKVKEAETIASSSAADEVKNARKEVSGGEEDEKEESAGVDEKETVAGEDEKETAAEEDEKEKTAGEEEYERGVLTEDAWESTFWNLRFAPPQGLSLLGEEELNSMMGLGEEILSENFNEQQVRYAQMMNVYEMMSTNLQGNANVVVTTEKLLASGFSAEDYLKAMKGTLTAVTTISYTVLEEGETYKIGDETYGVMKASGEGNGMILYQDYYVRVKGNRALAIAVTYTDDTLEMADEIINCFEAL